MNVKQACWWSGRVYRERGCTVHAQAASRHPDPALAPLLACFSYKLSKRESGRVHDSSLCFLAMHSQAEPQPLLLMPSSTNQKCVQMNVGASAAVPFEIRARGASLPPPYQQPAAARG